MTRLRYQGVPFVGQWMSRDRIGDILAGRLDARDDPLWRESGARTPDEYALWSWNWCGMDCVKMVLEHAGIPSPSLVELCQRCADAGGYVVRADGRTIDGLFYAPCLQFLREEFGVEGEVALPLTVEDILATMRAGRYVIASVSPEIRHPETTPRRTGGHLVLLTGFDAERRVLYLHNPSGDTRASQEYAEVSFAAFERFFARRGMLLALG